MLLRLMCGPDDHADVQFQYGIAVEKDQHL